MARKSRRTAILAYTDGACSGNPGPAGIGVVLICGARRKEMSGYIGHATSNIAELTAVIRALAAIRDPTRYVIVHSDSQYAIRSVTGDHKVRKNQALVAEARALAASFARLRFEWVPAHAGIPDNERCDELARRAIAAHRRVTARVIPAG